MSELREVQNAAARVLEEAKAASVRGELSDHVYIGFRLALLVHMMTVAHQPGARKVAREYAELVGIDFPRLDQQIGARIYELLVIARMEREVDTDE